ADHKLNSVEKYLQAFLGVAEDSVDAQDDLINLQNGVFNIQTQELMPHKREYYLTSQLPFKFDPDTDCPMFRRFLNQSLVGEDGKTDYDLQLLVLEAIGYSLTNNTDFRVSFWLVGASGTGKSVLINVLQELAGNSHTSIDLDQLSNNPYQIADIAGKRLVTFTEPKSNAVLADNHYKRLVSQDTIMARQIFGKPFRFRPQCKVWGAMNDLPRVVDRSDAIFNRIIIIPMNRVVPNHERDFQLIDKLRCELAGIFNMALVGLKRIRNAGKFTQVSQSEQARSEYKKENDYESNFVEDWCDIGNDFKVSGQALYDAYAAWCRRNGASAKSSTRVARDWKRLGFIKRRSNGTWYHGVKLNSRGAVYGI
ncbi:MAG: phage/plasmid primase, P4 family, partial [Chloroflexota bacterium]